MTRLRNWMYRQQLGVLIALAMMLHGLIPAGFMPDMNALQRGIATITICTADGFHKIADGSSDHGKQSKHDGGSFCPFAFGHHPTLAGAIAACCILPKLAEAVLQFGADSLHQQRLSLAAQPRAPPHILA